MKGASFVREARLRGGLTQAELARRLGTKQSVVSRWENGVSSPSLETLERIAGACGLEIHLRLADKDESDLTLALADEGLSPGQRIDRMVAGMSFIDELRSKVVD